MGERYRSREIAASDFVAHKSRAKFGNVLDGGRHFWVERMRNVWVAYHAGAPWMTGASWGVVESYVEQSNRWREEAVEALRGCRKEMVKVAQLTAEVERWRGAALELWMLLDAIDTAEDIAKDNDAWFRHRAHHLHEQRHRRVSSDDPAWEADGRDWSKLDALAREDGAG